MRDKIKNPAASLNLPDHQLYGSDLIAEALREQRFPYICLNPGASYRGLHDSLVNHLGNQTPEIITASAGHSGSQTPQSMHSSGLITSISSPS